MTIIDQFNNLKTGMEDWAEASKKALKAAIQAEEARQIAHGDMMAFLETLAHPERTADEMIDKIKEKLHL